ncbi:MAG: hypothetical protein A2538_04395 [Candidatus Magasanikbacteria bacterium RIFOXYD2_FULL_41_14]|uniref:Uncharacterized protein n=1 Tax=Candidatus Magasanikbacteria bacterium RIFOXYD2_FULL_41_14 TaxID=1798709 RepID=A0A1F6PEP5_9BACT|nr:MAG: hypothetical protein A2538_04395 [Candidatus Magasanikbacteria bacterium RIFOXYD2_FULL_41_14]
MAIARIELSSNTGMRVVLEVSKTGDVKIVEGDMDHDIVRAVGDLLRPLALYAQRKQVTYPGDDYREFFGSVVVRTNPHR